ncbi:MAG: methyltransferase [Ruminococcaceae bacterium]|nr:methyltransferase [Oscillospiraceae bacterium]
MKRNMKKWAEEMLKSKTKKAMPILSFPCVSLLGIKVSELIADSERQAEGMKLIAEKTDSAASVSLMDLSVEAECFGADVRFSDSEVPTVVGRMINDIDEAEALEVPKVGSARSGIYIEAIRRASEMITDRPVFAGMIGPFSLAARLLDVSEIMMDCYDDPDMVHIVLEKSTDFLIEYAKAYKDAGANGIVLAEPVSGLLSPSLESEFSAPYVRKIVDAVQDDEFILIYHNCGDNTVAMTDSFISIGAAAYHFGNSIDIRDMLEKFPADILIMGNVDPAGVLRLGNPNTVRQATLDVMNACCSYSNFVISSGCDIPPLTPWENINTFFETVDEFYGNTKNL